MSCISKLDEEIDNMTTMTGIVDGREAIQQAASGKSNADINSTAIIYRQRHPCFLPLTPQIP